MRPVIGLMVSAQRPSFSRVRAAGTDVVERESVEAVATCQYGRGRARRTGSDCWAAAQNGALREYAYSLGGRRAAYATAPNLPTIHSLSLTPINTSFPATNNRR